jgi:hypothetical protein
MPENQRGELTVSGEGEAIIALKRRPDRVECRFKHPHHRPPCDPDEDQLRCEFREVHEPRARWEHDRRRYELLIFWSVGGIREVEWRVEY